MKRFLSAVVIIVAMCVYGGYMYISSELEFLKTFVPQVDLPTVKNNEIMLVIFAADGLEMYKRYYLRSKKLPQDYDMTKLMFMADMIISGKGSHFDNKGIERWKLFLIKRHGIDPFSLKGVVLNHYADTLLAQNQLSGFRGEVVRWYTLARLKNAYSEDELYRMYLDTPAYAKNVYGIAAASEYYFGKPIGEASPLETAFLVAMISRGNLMTPEKDYAYLDKYAKVALRKLYEASLISGDEYSKESSRVIALSNINEYPVIEPSYVAEVLKTIQSDKRFNVGSETLKIYTGYNKHASDVARKVVERHLAGKDDSLQTSFVLVNRETGGVEAVIGSRVAESKRNRAITLKRQMASTFKPIVYMTAFERGFKPSDHIVDKPYAFKSGKFIYKPKNYEDFFMGDIPLRYGLVYSLNNATIRLAELTGLRRVRNMAVNIGMKGSIIPVHAMALGSFAATPLNVAQMYSTVGNYGVRKHPSLILRVETSGGKVYDMTEKPRRVVSEEAAYQTLYIMQDVASRGTARGAAMLKGTAAKTGTSDNYRDAWTVALFGKYVAVCWVGYDDFGSMGEDGSGGRMAAPVIGMFQRAYFPKGTTFKLPAPEGIEFHRVSAATGLLTETKGRRTYIEAYNKGNLPAKEVKTAKRK